MKKKAVIVGVGYYDGYAATLTAPTQEVGNWQGLLASYGFFDLRVLTDTDATRDEVLKAIRWLVSDSSKDDQLVFIFMGHGRIVKSEIDGGPPFEEALMVYPNGDSTLANGEIRERNIAAILEEEEVPEGVDIAAILDCCFAAYFDFPIPEGAQPLFIPNPAFGEVQISDVREFGSFATGIGRQIERPIVVAACGRDQLAYEIPTGSGTARMLFTWRLTDHVRRNPMATFAAVVKDVYPMEPGYETQKPEIRGNTGRAGEQFPGESDSQRVRPAFRALQPVTRMATATFARMAAATSLIDIDFEGIVCFAGQRSVTDPYVMRALFPFDGRVDPNKRHFAFVEIRKDDVESFTGPAPKEYKRTPSNPVVYLGWEPHGHRIDVASIDRTRPFSPSNGFRRHVPKMTDVYPPFRISQFHPRSECFADAPATTVLDAYLNLAHGELSSGPPDDFETIFKPDVGPVTLRIFSCRNTFLRLWLTSDNARIVLTPYAGGAASEIILKPGARARFGSAREGDLRSDGTTENAREHFELFYHLANPKPQDPPKPTGSGVPVNFCSQTTWP